jgi:hypothetical protein
MATTTGRDWDSVLPTQNTSPPDVVKYLTDALVKVDGSLLFGPEGSVPANLPVGVLYFGYTP